MANKIISNYDRHTREQNAKHQRARRARLAKSGYVEVRAYVLKSEAARVREMLAVAIAELNVNAKR